MGGGDKTNQSITPIPVLLFLARERKRGEHLSSRKSVLARTKRKRTFFASRSGQREETSDRLSLGKLSARLERVASRPPPSFASTSPSPQFFNRSFRVFNAKNLRKVSLRSNSWIRNDEFKRRRRLRNYLIAYTNLNLDFSFCSIWMIQWMLLMKWIFF